MRYLGACEKSQFVEEGDDLEKLAAASLCQAKNPRPARIKAFSTPIAVDSPVMLERSRLVSPAEATLQRPQQSTASANQGFGSQEKLSARP